MNGELFQHQMYFAGMCVVPFLISLFGTEICLYVTTLVHKFVFS